MSTKFSKLALLLVVLFFFSNAYGLTEEEKDYLKAFTTQMKLKWDIKKIEEACWEFRGLYCDANESVSRINLVGEGMYESYGHNVVPKGIGSLKSIKRFILPKIFQLGPLPEDMADIDWEEIDIVEGTISGSPTWLEGQKNLRTLKITSNRMSGPIPDWLGDLESLEILDFSGNRLNGTIPNSLAKLSKLKQLSLNQNKFSGVDDNFLGASTLEKLELDYTPIDTTSKLSFLSSYKDLTRLSLKRCGMKGTFPTWIQSMPKLEYLNLEYNQLTGPLPSNLGETNPHLTHLLLSGNSQLDFSSFEAATSKLSKLNSLSANQIPINGSFPLWLFDHPSIVTMFLSDTGLTGSLPLLLSLEKKLVTFDVSSNNLSGPLPTWLFTQTNLSRIALLKNNFSCPTETIPPALRSKPKSCDIRHNNLCTGNDIFLPNCRGVLSDTCNLTPCTFTGKVDEVSRGQTIVFNYGAGNNVNTIYSDNPGVGMSIKNNDGSDLISFSLSVTDVFSASTLLYEDFGDPSHQSNFIFDNEFSSSESLSWGRTSFNFSNGEKNQDISQVDYETSTPTGGRAKVSFLHIPNEDTLLVENFDYEVTNHTIKMMTEMTNWFHNVPNQVRMIGMRVDIKSSEEFYMHALHDPLFPARLYGQFLFEHRESGVNLTLRAPPLVTGDDRSYVDLVSIGINDLDMFAVFFLGRPAKHISFEVYFHAEERAFYDPDLSLLFNIRNTPTPRPNTPDEPKPPTDIIVPSTPPASPEPGLSSGTSHPENNDGVIAAVVIIGVLIVLIVAFIIMVNKVPALTRIFMPGRAATIAMKNTVAKVSTMEL